MDGTDFKINKPEQDPQSYFNRKKQAVCDSDQRLTDIFIGYPGSVHDARVFRNSTLYQDLGGRCGNAVILADSAYPCLQQVLTPYRDNGNLTAKERHFNKQLSKCRVTIEHTFAMLEQRFRQLYHLEARKIDDVCHFIRAIYI
nr:unnamed protein product [Callosobruchus analis]